MLFRFRALRYCASSRSSCSGVGRLTGLVDAGLAARGFGLALGARPADCFVFAVGLGAVDAVFAGVAEAGFADARGLLDAFSGSRSSSASRAT